MFTKMYDLSRNNEITKKFLIFVAEAETQLDCKINKARSDGGKHDTTFHK